MSTWATALYSGGAEAKISASLQRFRRADLVHWPAGRPFVTYSKLLLGRRNNPRILCTPTSSEASERKSHRPLPAAEVGQWMGGENPAGSDCQIRRPPPSLPPFSLSSPAFIVDASQRRQQKQHAETNWTSESFCAHLVFGACKAPGFCVCYRGFCWAGDEAHSNLFVATLT